MKLSTSHASHPGRIRDSNEDACLVDPEAGVFVLCDGVGGNAAGEVASQLGVATLVAAVRAGRSLLHAALDAHAAVQSAARGERQGMAATLVAARVRDKHADLVWAGDSPGYVLAVRERRCRLLTPAHSLVAELVTLGKLNLDETREHPMRHVITQSLGIVGKPFAPSQCRVRLRHGDRLLLVSDGVSDVLDEGALWELAGPQVAIAGAAEAVVNAAVERSGHDNTSAIVVEVHYPPGLLARWFGRADAA